MEKPIVHHGSKEVFDSEYARPTQQIRTEILETGEERVIFDEESFHATPHKWIALAYSYDPKPFELDGVSHQHHMAVSLYENTGVVTIFGAGSLEESLQALYGGGGYLYHFDGDKFVYKEGLGNLEVVVNEPTKPMSVEKVDDPVAEMRKLGVTFEFIDLSLPENEKYRS